MGGWLGGNGREDDGHEGIKNKNEIRKAKCKKEAGASIKESTGYIIEQLFCIVNCLIY
jgi:hypothetical protein